MEHKYIALTQLKARNEGNGGWEGYLSKFGELDDGGDIVAEGAFTDTIPQFLARGFGTESHDWTFSKLIGFPTAAKEDNTGLQVAFEYHSTPDAQLVRTKAQERMAAGLGVYMSIGYEPSTPPVVILPKDYAAEIPKYSPPGMAEQNLAKATKFNRVRVLPKLELYEGAIVSVPMLRSATVSSIKSAVRPQSKAGFEEEFQETINEPWLLWSVFCDVLCDIQAQDEAAEAMMLPFDFAGAVRAAVQEFAARLESAIIEADAQEDAQEAAGQVDPEDAQEGMGIGMDMGTGYSGKPRASQKGRPRAGRTLEMQTGMVRDAIAGLKERLTDQARLALKEGRAISEGRRSRIRALRESMSEMMAELDGLLEETEPGKAKPKQSPITQDVILAMVRRDSARRGVTLK